MASDGLRTIGLAFKDIVLNKENENEVSFCYLLKKKNKRIIIVLFLGII